MLAEAFEFFNIEEKDWYTIDGVSYDTLEDVVQCHILEFCGCGTPDENVLYIRDSLNLINFLNTETEGREEHNKIWEEYSKKCEDLFGNKEAQYFMFYFLDKEGLTEHGGSVPGWLTDKGEHLLVILNSI